MTGRTISGAGVALRAVALLAAFAFTVVGCGQDQVTPLPAATSTATVPLGDSGFPCGRVCAPGSTELCYCPDTHQTAQTCAADGKSWEPCPCGGASTDGSLAR
ncbi:MAG TPA: hypothetical protein VH062_26155 [Polyangiaceae bacterium]|jgi:hypothetical protein|nr:hypothetical protein [Polyangiaceae bacterium]